MPHNIDAGAANRAIPARPPDGLIIYCSEIDTTRGDHG
jgi:hypothetical protein